MNLTLSDKLLRIAKNLLILGIVLSLITISLYIYVFGYQSNFTLSTTDNNWANFGSYIGGVLGPIFSFLAFSGVILTVWLQAKQLDVSRNQANFEEIQRVLSNISLRIDNLLAQAPNQHIEHIKLRDAPINILTCVSAAGTVALSNPIDHLSQASNEQLITIVKKSIEIEAMTIGLELEQLAWCLNEYHSQSGHITVIEFYKRRYRAIVCWLDAIGLLSAHPYVQDYFNPKSFQEFLKPSS